MYLGVLFICLYSQTWAKRMSVRNCTFNFPKYALDICIELSLSSRGSHEWYYTHTYVSPESSPKPKRQSSDSKSREHPLGILQIASQISAAWLKQGTMNKCCLGYIVSEIKHKGWSGSNNSINIYTYSFFWQFHTNHSNTSNNYVVFTNRIQ